MRGGTSTRLGKCREATRVALCPGVLMTRKEKHDGNGSDGDDRGMVGMMVAAVVMVTMTHDRGCGDDGADAVVTLAMGTTMGMLTLTTFISTKIRCQRNREIQWMRMVLPR